jgi:hypothetical protein
VLSPNDWHGGALTRVEALPSGRVIAFELSSSPNSSWIRIRVPGGSTLSAAERGVIKANVRQMLRLDEDLSDFYHLCEEMGGRWRRVTRGLGRLLRSPTVFEDVVKTICTTNIQWSGTKRMIQGLVQEFGEPLPDDPVRLTTRRGPERFFYGSGSIGVQGGVYPHTCGASGVGIAGYRIFEG